jgi:hypothetical protein
MKTSDNLVLIDIFFLTKDFIECYENVFLFQVQSRDKILYAVLRHSEPLILYIVKSKRSEIVGSIITFENISNLFHHTNVIQV